MQPKKHLRTYSAVNAKSRLFFSLFFSDSLQSSMAIQKVIWYIQILLRHPIIIIILRVFRHICYGNCSSDGHALPPSWHPKSVLPRAVTIHQLNLKDHKRTSPQASMLLFNKKAMFHSSSVKEPPRKSAKGMHLPFHPSHRRLTHETCLSEIWGYEVTGKPNDFLKDKGQLDKSHISFTHKTTC